MSKLCTIRLESGERCNTRVPLKDYAEHIRKHGLEITANTISNYVRIEEQVEHILDESAAAVNDDGVACDLVLRRYYRMAIYDITTKCVEIKLPYEEFIKSLIPLISSICRAWRNLRKEAQEHPELHPDWKLSEHVIVRHTYQERAFRMFFTGRGNGI